MGGGAGRSTPPVGRPEGPRGGSSGTTNTAFFKAMK